MPGSEEEPEPTSSGVPVRPSDLPLLYTLAFVHVAVLVALPVAAWFIVRFLKNWPGLSSREVLVPLLVGVVVLVEIGLFWRTRRVWRRIRDVGPAHDIHGGWDPPK
jgi:hypothetical protein